MRKRSHRTAGMLATVLVSLAVAGCAPGYQPPAPGQQVPGAGVTSTTGWADIAQAVRLGQAEAMYMVKGSVDVLEGTLHSNFSVYGSVNPPDKALLSLHAYKTSTRFYQQGLSAYEQQDRRWVQTDALQNLDMYAPYGKIVDQAEKMNVPISQLPDAFVVDEYCHVYQAEIPTTFEAGLPIWDPVLIRDMKPSPTVLYTFAVGKDDGLLREVTTQNVGAVTNVGGVQVSSDTEFFSFGKKQSEVQIPNDLFAQLITLSFAK